MANLESFHSADSISELDEDVVEKYMVIVDIYV